MNIIRVENNKLISNFKLDNNDNDIYLDNIDICIIYKNSDISYNFIISNNVKIFEYFNCSNINNKYNLNKNSYLNLNRFCFDCSLKTNIDIQENSSLIYNYSCLNLNDNFYEINVSHKKNATSKIINNGLNMTNSKLDFLINSSISKDSFNVTTFQDSKIILMDDNNSSIKPNLIIDNDDISASHACYIGSFKDEVLFYLKSRGIGELQSKKILAKAFLIGNMELDYFAINMILEDLNENWR